MRLRIRHRTAFRYAGQARDSFNEVRLGPLDDDNQRQLSLQIAVMPWANLRAYRDFHGNTVNYFDIHIPHTALEVVSVSEVETRADAGRPAPPIVPIASIAEDPEYFRLGEFLSATALVPCDAPEVRHEVKEIGSFVFIDVVSETIRLGCHINASFTYAPGETRVNTTAVQALLARRGVCQDYAHTMIALCRASGIPARYVSGYFFNDTRLPGEIEASHAWVETHVPGFGWYAFDPTHNRPADERYVKIATGRDYADVRPVAGTYTGPKTDSFTVEVTVERIG